MVEFIDKTADKSGTPLNRATMMAIQGFVGISTDFVTDDEGNIKTIREVNSKGEILTTTINADGSITETFEGEKIIVKNIYFSSENSLTEVLS